MTRQFISKRDFIIIAVVILAAAVLWLLRDDTVGQQAQISIDGRPVMIIDLATDSYIVIESLPYVQFKVQDGAVAFVKSDCPDQICVNTGFLRIAGQEAICMPNRTSLTVLSEDVDAIVY